MAQSADVQLKLKEAFLKQPRFAVVGASKDQSKWGTKILQWYKQREYDVTPVHPRETELEGLQAVKSLSEVPQLASTSVSVITPPPITLSLLTSMVNSPPTAAYVWLQPGTYDDAVVSFIESNHIDDQVIYGNHACVWAEGDRIRARL